MRWASGCIVKLRYETANHAAGPRLTRRISSPAISFMLSVLLSRALRWWRADHRAANRRSREPGSAPCPTSTKVKPSMRRAPRQASPPDACTRCPEQVMVVQPERGSSYERKDPVADRPTKAPRLGGSIPRTLWRGAREIRTPLRLACSSACACTADVRHSRAPATRRWWCTDNTHSRAGRCAEALCIRPSNASRGLPVVPAGPRLPTTSNDCSSNGRPPSSARNAGRPASRRVVVHSRCSRPTERPRRAAFRHVHSAPPRRQSPRRPESSQPARPYPPRRAWLRRFRWPPSCSSLRPTPSRCR